MTIAVIKPAAPKHRAMCLRCGTRFTYELADTWKNYLRGYEVVSCPGCSESVKHRRLP